MEDFSVRLLIIVFLTEILNIFQIHLRFFHTFSLSFKNRSEQVLISTTNYKDFQQKVRISTGGGEKVLRLMEDINDWAMLGKILIEINLKAANI